MSEKLTISNVYKNYKQGDAVIPVLKGISATFEQGQSYGITGVSGSGKSTLIHLLAGLDSPTKGDVWYGDMDISTFSAIKKGHFLNKIIGLVFQYPYLIKELTILENVMIKGLIAGYSFDESTEASIALLINVGLDSKIYAYPGQLSGGQQQRAALARALMNKPKFLLADEPTGNLDPHTADAILNLIIHAQEEWGMGLIIASHDRFVTERMQSVWKVVDGLLVV